MRVARQIGSAFLVLLGSMLIVGWALSVESVRSIEDGSATETFTTRIVDTPETADLIADALVRALEQQVDSDVGGLVIGLLDGQIRELALTIVQSEGFQAFALERTERVQQALLDELSEPGRPSAPFTLEVDVSDRVNARIDEVPVVGPLVPDLTLASLEVELIDADTFDDARAGYGALTFAATWFVWLGLLLIAGGIALAPRWRWFLPRALVGAAAIGVAGALTLGILGPPTIAGFMPGGREGGLGALVEQVVADGALQPVTSVLLTLAMIALALAASFVLILRFLPDDRGAVDDGEPVADTEELPTTSHPEAGRSTR